MELKDPPGRDGRDEQPQVERASTAATLWLVASGVSLDALVAECGFERDVSVSRFPATLELAEFCQALLKTVEGLTPHQAEVLAREAKSGPTTVSLDLWKGLFREASARVEAAIDLLQEVIGAEELGWLVEQLAALGMFATLPRTQLVALIAQKRPWHGGPTWGLVEEMLRLIDPLGLGEVPARPLARLLSKRAESYWQHLATPATPEIVETQESTESQKLEETTRNGFVAPQLFAARQLISALLCLIRAGELDIDLVAEQLDAAAIQVSEAKPTLWCSTSPEPVALAGILENDPEGTSRALEIWQSLHLPTSASAAILALKCLSIVEASRASTRFRLRVLESRIQGLVLQPQTISSSTGSLDFSGSARMFQALLSVGMGPEQLRSRLRTWCGTDGPNKVYLDQFAACLQRSGVIMAAADLLEAIRREYDQFRVSTLVTSTYQYMVDINR